MTHMHTHTLLHCQIQHSRHIIPQSQQTEWLPDYLSMTAEVGKTRKRRLVVVIVILCFTQRVIFLPHLHSLPLVGGYGHHLSQKLLDLPPHEVRGSITALALAYGCRDRSHPQTGQTGQTGIEALNLVQPVLCSMGECAGKVCQSSTTTEIIA